MTQENNVRFVVGNSNGEIIRYVSCPINMLNDLTAAYTIWAVSDTATEKTHYFYNNQLIEYSAAIKQLKENKPVGRVEWSNETMSWLDNLTLDQHKTLQWDLIKNKRDSLEIVGFPYLGKTIDSDSLSVQRINTAVQAAQAAMAIGMPFSLSWTCQDSSLLVLDGPGMLGMAVALAEYANELHETARSLRSQIDAATTIEAVKAIVWPAI
jgi:hypothetical protein